MAIAGSQTITLSGTTAQQVRFDIREASRLGMFSVLLELKSGTCTSIDIKTFASYLKYTAASAAANLDTAYATDSLWFDDSVNSIVTHKTDFDLDAVTGDAACISINPAYAALSASDSAQKHFMSDGLVVQLTGETGDDAVIGVRLITPERKI